MGCKLCCEDNKEKKDLNLAMNINKPEVFIPSNDDINNHSYLTSELLNEKYSIPPKSKDNNLDDNENKNIYNYTQNIVNNNYIQYSSRNKPISEKDNKIISSIRREKADFSSMDRTSIYFNKEENSIIKNETNKLTENSNLNNNISSTNDKEIKNKHKHHKHKHKHTHSNKNEEEENNKKSKHKSKSKDKKTEKEEDNKIDTNDKDNNEEIKGISPKQMKEKIKELLKQINYKKIDKILEEAPSRTETTLEKLIKYFKKKSKKLLEVEKSWIIYKWITMNIEYDFKGVNDKNYDISEEATFNRGKSICSGYANLFKKFSDNLDLIVEIIGGYSKGFNYEITDKFEESESHAWNVVKINDDWYFIETTWGAGYGEDHKKFIKRFTPYYFFTPPIQFVRGHFPNEKKWQLLPKKEMVDQKKFMEFVDLKSNFYDLGFDYIDPDYTFNHANKKGSFKIFFNENEIDGNKLKVMATLHYVLNIEKNPDENVKLINIQEVQNSTFVIRNKNYFEINYLLNKKGKFKLQIFGAKKESEKYDELCTLILISKKESPTLLTFPKVYGPYNQSDVQLIQPMSGILYNGDTINFEIKSSSFKNLYICITNTDNSNNFIEMEKQGNIFKEEDILIYGKQVKISTKSTKENNYDTLIEYNVEINPKNEKDIVKFPKTFSGPKNRLIEPICEKIRNGKSVIFKIKSDVIEEMAVFVGDNCHKLDKNDDIFYGKFKIEGKGKMVQIGYLKENNQYGILYQYNIT